MDQVASGDDQHRDEGLTTMQLCYAAARGDVEQLSVLLASRADANQGDYEGRTPLLVATGKGQCKAALALLQGGADPNVPDHYGQTPLSESERVRESGIEALLLKHGALFGLSAMKAMALQEKWSVNRSNVELQEKLSETIKSEVFVASWMDTKVVAKLVKHDALEQSTMRKELLHEMRLLSTIRHPNLVMFYGACLDDPVMILLEFMPGGDLERHYQRKRQETQSDVYIAKFPLVLVWASDVASALCFLHNRQPPLIHRDLKPLNILMSDDHKRVKVTDFGISATMKMKPRFLDEARKSSMHVEVGRRTSLRSQMTEDYRMTGGVGSWRYMPPEVVRHDRYNEKADIYTFALVLFFMSAGREPFYEFGRDAELVLQEYLQGNDPRPKVKDCLAPFRTIMSLAWQKDPMMRPSANDLSSMLAGLDKDDKSCAGCSIS